MSNLYHFWYNSNSTLTT